MGKHNRQSLARMLVLKKLKKMLTIKKIARADTQVQELKSPLLFFYASRPTHTLTNGRQVRLPPLEARTPCISGITSTRTEWITALMQPRLEHVTSIIIVSRFTSLDDFSQLKRDGLRQGCQNCFQSLPHLVTVMVITRGVQR